MNCNLTKMIAWKAIICMFFAYIIPIFNIVFLMVMRQEFYLLNLMEKNVINILLATNTCFIVNILNVIDKKRREFLFLLTFIIGLLNFGLFIVSIIEIEKNLILIPNLNIYKYTIIGTILILLVSCIPAKGDEIESAQTFANESKKVNKVDIGGKQLKL